MLCVVYVAPKIPLFFLHISTSKQPRAGYIFLLGFRDDLQSGRSLYIWDLGNGNCLSCLYWNAQHGDTRCIDGKRTGCIALPLLMWKAGMAMGSWRGFVNIVVRKTALESSLSGKSLNMPSSQYCTIPILILHTSTSTSTFPSRKTRSRVQG